MHPAFFLVGSLVGTYLLYREKEPAPTPTRSGFVPVPIPPPNADGSPPKDMRVAPLVNLQADLSGVFQTPIGARTLVADKPPTHGIPVSVAWEYMPGHPFAGEGGGAPLPLLWVSPDRKFAAVLWTLDPALGVTFAKPGDILLAFASKG
jgi:hypothetical protein